MKKITTSLIVSLFVVSALMFISSAIAAENSANSQKGGVSNIESQTLIYENTAHGKKTSEWMKGKTVKPDCTPAMNRVGWSEGCKK